MLTKFDIKTLELAKRLAIAAPNPVRNYRLAAIVTIKNEIISFGNNQLKTHPFCAKFKEKDFNVFFHAETNAIFNALKIVNENDLKKANLYIYRVKKEQSHSCLWTHGLSYPCNSCMNAINNYKIPKIIYTTDEGINVLNLK